MARNEREQSALDLGTLTWGMVLGLLVGGITTLLNAPKRGKQTREQITTLPQVVRERIEAALPTDPVQESLDAGKAAARRRREELGLLPAEVPSRED